MNITNELKKINVNNERIALLIRHADRDKIPNGVIGDDYLLNDAGVKNSIEFGKNIKNYEINKIFTSPIQRNCQTAKYINEGYGVETEIIKTISLGDPGLHVTNGELLWQYYQKNGFWNIFEKFKNNENVPGLKPKLEFKNDLNNFINSNTQNNGLTLFITHDWLIAFFAHAIGYCDFTTANWVNFLSGLILKVE